ncbi:MAG: DUF2505 family protein [Polyangiaceae bacterium]|nr:DUF2505 family protein [Polyangiaceae bacterium]
MADVRLEHVHNCGVDTFWKVFFDLEYQTTLFCDGMRFPSFEQLSFEETDRQIRRVIRVTPRLVGIPGPLQKVIGDGVSYEEHGVFDKTSKTFKYSIKTSRMPDKVKTDGVVYCVPAGEGKSKRIFEMTVVAKIFGVGAMIEKQIIQDTTRDYATGAQFTNKYLAAKGLG